VNADARRELALLALFVAVVAALYLYLYRNILGVGLLQASDFGVPPANIQQLEAYLLNAYSFQSLGPGGFAPVIILQGLMGIAAGSPAIAQKVFYYPSMPLAALTAYFLLYKMRYRWSLRAPLAILYSLSPWMIGEFMTGEPGAVYLYALFPLVAYFLWRAGEAKLSALDAMLLALLLAAASGATLQSLFVYAALGLPFIVRFLLRLRPRDAAHNLLALLAAAALGVASISYSLEPYLAAYSGESAAPSSSLFGAFLSQPAMALTPYLCLLSAAVGALAAAELLTGASGEREYLLSSAVVAASFLLIYATIASPATQGAFRGLLLLLAPFQNWDKWALVEWNAAFLGLVMFLRPAAGPSRPRAGGRKMLGVAVVAALVLSVLLVSTVYATIQPEGAHDYGLYFLQGEFNFPQQQVPPQYQELENFLLSRGAGFGYSFRTIIVPGTPGYNINPFYMGSQMVPGFLGLMPPSTANLILSGVQQNDQALSLLPLTLLGVKYIAVIRNLPTGWPYWNSTPNINWWGGMGLFNGYWTYYNETFSGWTLLRPVYSAPGIVVYENELLRSPVLEVTNAALLRDLDSGNLTAAARMIDYTPAGPSIAGVRQLAYVADGTTINISGIVPSDGAVLLLDVPYHPLWRLRAGDAIVRPAEGPLGLLAFNITGINASSVTIYYAGQAEYDVLLALSFATFASIASAALYLAARSRIRSAGAAPHGRISRGGPPGVPPARDPESR